MPRPIKYRKICCSPAAYYFKPRGIPVYELEEVVLNHDELESLRLADLLALSHEDAAKQMNISRATFGRIVESARKKTADCILNGKAIRINENLNIKNTGASNENCSCNKRRKQGNGSYR